MADGDYPRPSLTADVVLLRHHVGRIQVLLIERRKDPFAGFFALPGGFVGPDESPRQGAARELLEETATEARLLVDVGTFGDPGRDPRGWIVSAAFLGLAAHDVYARAGDDASEVRWFALDDLPKLAFDHDRVIAAARERLAQLAQSTTAPLMLLKAPFRTRQARHLYVQITGRSIPPRAFKAWLRRREVVERVGPAKFSAREAMHPDWVR